MSAEAASQALNSRNLIALKDAMLWFHTVQRCLSPRTGEMVMHIILTTIGMGIDKRPINQTFLERGAEANPETGFMGVAGITPVSRTAHDKAFAEAIAEGVIIKDSDGLVSVNVGITPLELVQHESVVKRLMQSAKNGILATIEGIIAWATRLSAFSLKQACTAASQASRSAQAEQPKPLENNDATYSLHEKDNILPPKGGRIYARGLLARISENIMGRTPAQILSDVTAQVADKYNRLQQKRAKRQSIADLCNMFEAAWRKGQHERDRSVLAARLVARDRKLLKDQIIYPSRELDMNIVDFAEWVAVHWDAIGAAYFKKAKSYPAAPAFPWLVRCLETYVTAYRNRDSLDPTGKLPDAARASASAVAAISARVEKAIAAQADDIDDLRRQLAEAQRENEKLKLERGLPVEDDPVYARVIKQARRPVAIGRYDDEEPAPAKPIRKRIRK